MQATGFLCPNLADASGPLNGKAGREQFPSPASLKRPYHFSSTADCSAHCPPTLLEKPFAPQTGKYIFKSFRYGRGVEQTVKCSCLFFISF